MICICLKSSYTFFLFTSIASCNCKKNETEKFSSATLRQSTFRVPDMTLEQTLSMRKKRKNDVISSVVRKKDHVFSTFCKKIQKKSIPPHELRKRHVFLPSFLRPQSRLRSSGSKKSVFWNKEDSPFRNGAPSWPAPFRDRRSRCPAPSSGFSLGPACCPSKTTAKHRLRPRSVRRAHGPVRPGTAHCVHGVAMLHTCGANSAVSTAKLVERRPPRQAFSPRKVSAQRHAEVQTAEAEKQKLLRAALPCDAAGSPWTRRARPHAPKEATAAVRQHGARKDNGRPLPQAAQKFLRLPVFRFRNMTGRFQNADA